MLFQQKISTIPFKLWLLQDTENKRLLWWAAGIMVVSFTWLKIMYPYPNFMPPDSNAYIDSAAKNEWINLWATGYSKFLRLVSLFSNNHVALVILQYILLQLGVLYFLFTLRYLLSPERALFRIIYLLVIACPLLPHISNFVSSDGIFTGLSLIWFTQLLWIIDQPKKRLLLWHALVVLLAFMVRFNALYYPVISVLVIVCKQVTWRLKILGIASMLVLLLIYIGRIQYEYYEKTGTVQFAAFSGWQIAANALYGYAHAKPDQLHNVPWPYHELHKIVNHHMDSLRQLRYRPDNEPGVYYMWDFASPLVVYLKKDWKKDDQKTYFQRWAAVAPLYAKYGRWLILHHPGPFIKYYAWPNFLKYYHPPGYFMERYNMGNERADSVACAWFGWKNNYLPTWGNNRVIKITRLFTSLVAIVNPLFLLCGIIFMLSKDFRTSSQLSKNIIRCMLLTWVANTVFSVLAAPIELRYQLFPFIMTLVFCSLFVYQVMKSMLTVHEKHTKKASTLPNPAF